jgi:hypothetical protein
MSMSHHHTKPGQLELFGPPEVTSSLQTPQWQNLPGQARNEVTSLVVRLLMEHSHRERNEPGGAVVQPLLSKANGDV